MIQRTFLTNILTARYRQKNLKSLYDDAVKAICEDPAIGGPKRGYWEVVLGYDFYYNKTTDM